MVNPNRQRKLLISMIFVMFVWSVPAYAISSSAAGYPGSDLLAWLKASGNAPYSTVVVRRSDDIAATSNRHGDIDTPLHDADVADAVDNLVSMAMALRNIPYRRGGRSPSSGFDCSGFVRYVFLHSIGLDLPATSASQFVSGFKVARGEMRSGDLVFFKTTKKNRISHVGIYLDDGRFIHAPSSGKVVRIDSLSTGYWSKRFAGAKRVGETLG